ncbi:MAG: T9SS type A sorting domain-containing protein [Flavobacteriales bacterium]|nr:T9SS type A sorting domain-containing protein [Flavobacteriales bacterium]
MKKILLSALSLISLTPIFSQSLDDLTLSTNGTVEVIKQDGDTIYIGGNFSSVGYQTQRIVLVDPLTGLLSEELPSLNSTVNVVIPDGAGGWYIGGAFSTLDGNTINRIVRLNSNNNPDPTFNCDLNSTVNELYLDGDDLYIGGSISVVNGNDVRRLFRVNATTGVLDNSWLPTIGFGTVNGIVRSGDFVYAGGSFNVVDGVDDNRYIIKIDAVTAETQDFISANNTVSDLLLNGNDLILAGSFTRLDYFKSNLAVFDTGDAVPDLSFGDLSTSVSEIISSGDGGFYICGNFTEFGGEPITKVFKLLPDGTTDPTFDPGDINGTVFAIHYDGTHVYVGGSFSTISGEAVTSIARLEATTGALDLSWAPGNTSSGIETIESNSTKVFVGGTFTTIDGSTASPRFAVLSKTDGSLITAPSVNSTVLTMEKSGEDIYVGGSFTTAGKPADNIALTDNLTGAVNQAFPEANSTVNTFIEDGNGGWFVGGAFSQFDGISVDRVVHILPDFSVDFTFSCEPNNTIEALFLDGNNLYLGGQFTTINGNILTRVARVNATSGFPDVAWNPEVSSTVLAIADAGTEIAIGGFFTSIDGEEEDRYFAKISKTTGDVVPGLAANNSVLSLANSSSSVFAGGSFTNVGYYKRGFASFENNSEIPTREFPVTNGNVNKVITDGAGGYFAIGSFSTVDGLSRDNFVHILADGSVDSDFNLVFNNTVSDIFLDGNDLYISGNFTFAGGLPVSRLARIDATTGEVDENFAPQFNLSVNTIHVDNNTIYLGGSFTTVEGSTRNRVAAVDNNGNLLPWDPNSNGIVEDIEVGNGLVYLAGSFSLLDGVSATRLAAVDPTTAAISFNANANSTVNSIALSGNSLFAGGSFTTINGESRSRLAEVDALTGVVQTLNIPINSTVSEVQISGNLLGVVGLFTEAGGQDRNRFAEINTSTNSLSTRILSFDNVLNSLLYDGTDVVFGGNFSFVNPISRSRFAEFDNASNDLTTFEAGSLNSNVEAIILDQGQLYIAGAFSAPRSRLAIYDAATGDLDPFSVSINSTVLDLSINGDILYLGGFFSNIEGEERKSAAAIDLNSGNLTNWNPAPNSTVRAILATDSQVLLGGSFATLNEVDLSRLAIYDDQTNNLLPLYSGTTSSNVRELFIDGDRLYVGGDFTSFNGVSRSRFAEFDLTNEEVTPLNIAFNNSVNSIDKEGDNLFFSGTFSSVDGEPRTRLCEYNLSTGLTAWNPTPNSTVEDLEVDAGRIYVGGIFGTIEVAARERVASIDLNTGLLNDLDLDFNSASVFDIELVGETLYLGGSFTTLNGESRDRLASVNVNTGAVNPLSLDINNTVNSVNIYNDTLYFGGSFTDIGGVERFRAASADLSTGLLTDFNPKLDNVVEDIVALDGEVIAGGSFTRTGFEDRSRFAAYRLSDNQILTLNESGFTSGTVEDILISEDRIYIAGGFSFINGISRNKVAAFSKSDFSLLDFNPNANSTVFSLLLDNDELYLGGGFSTVGGVSRLNVASVDAVSGELSDFDVPANGGVRALAKNGNTLYIGGEFSLLNGVARTRIGAVDVVSQNLTPFNPAANSTVEEFLIDNGLLYTGGSFSQIGGQFISSLAVFSLSDGSLTDFDLDLNGRVAAIDVEDNYLFIGGTFNDVSGQDASRLALVDAITGDVLLDFLPDVNSTVEDVLYNDGKLYAGGSFTEIDGNTNHPYSATWSVPPPGSVTFSTTLTATTDFNGFNVPCNGDELGEVSIALAGGTGPYNYTLTLSSGGFSRSGTINTSGDTGLESDLPSGTFNILVEDALGGFAVGSIELTEPPVFTVDIDQLDEVQTPGGNEASLEIDVLSGGAIPIDYSYTVNSGISITGQITDISQPFVLENLAGGNYNFDFTDANGCVSFESIEIEDYLPLVVNFTKSDEIKCNGDENGRIFFQIFEGSPPYDYLLDASDDNFDRSGTLNFSGASRLENNLGEGTYNLTVTDATGAQITAGPLEFVEPELLSFAATLQANVSFLGGSDGRIGVQIEGGTPNYTIFYPLSGGANFSAFSDGTDVLLENLSAGTYTVEVTDSEGCDTEPQVIEVLEGVNPCESLGGDADFDGICDDFDPCIGFVDALGVCNGGCPADNNNNGICDTEEEAENNPLTCADGLDNDGDGLADCDDPQCQLINQNEGCATCFQDGLSFADVVLTYDNNCPNNTQLDANSSIGLPDIDSGPENAVSLGGGSIRLGFTNNTLINSGDDNPDLFVFEVGPQVEGSNIELRPTNQSTIDILDANGILDEDGDGYYEFGAIGGATASVDIDEFFSPALATNSVQFDAIKISDPDPDDCGTLTPGPDIDAVCALSSLDCVIGAPCDDGNPSTIDDAFDSNCECVGNQICIADAGTLTAAETPVELDAPQVTITAIPDGNTVIPSGYASRFVLTSGIGLIIEEISVSSSFTVNMTGLYTIHTLVYDPSPVSTNFLDLSGIIEGVTPASDILDQIASTGICADLDGAGAPIEVIECLAGDTDSDGLCDNIDPCPLLPNVSNGDPCGINGIISNCECVEICPISLGTPSVLCLDNTLGDDLFEVQIPYFGVEPNGVITVGNSGGCTNGSITVSGDDPTTTPNGTIILTTSESSSCWSWSLSSPSCDLDIGGVAPSCDPAPCGLTLGSPVASCSSETNGNDEYTVSIPYTGLADGGTLSAGSSTNCQNGSIVISGDDPTLVNNGTIILTATEGDCWSISIQSAACDILLEGEAPVCEPDPCELDIIDFSVDDNCDPTTGIYGASATLVYANEPSAGLLTVNGINFPITGSPQTVDLEFVEGVVTFSALFTDDAACATSLSTGIVLTACEQDCEGVFDGDALPGTACDANGEAGTYDDNCNCIPDVNCSLEITSVDVADACDPATGLYSASVELTYVDAPADGFLLVNGEEFMIIGSPQTVNISFVEGPVSVEAAFSEESSCSDFEQTGIVLVACEQDCEGVFDGDALPGTACQLGGAVGTYDLNCTCVPDISCALEITSVDVPDACDPMTGLYGVTVNLEYIDAPADGLLVVNGEEFMITGSPQAVILDFVEGPVNITAAFSANTECNATFATGAILTACEEDCEGVFDGDALPGTPCNITGLPGTYDDNCNCIPDINCSLIVNSFEISDQCDPMTGLYSVMVELSYVDAPMTGVLVVNDQEAEITGSPQIVMLEIAESDVVIEAFFSEDPTCNTTLQTGVTLDACEQDCEGVFDGHALPGTACTVGGEAGTYNDECDCIPDISCSLIVNSADVTDACDPFTGLYTAIVELSFVDAPADGFLVVNGNEFEIEESPQTVSLDFVEGDVIIEAFFSEEPTCGATLNTGLTLVACEPDCEGVFNGGALPGTPCTIGGEPGIYDIDCECIPDGVCTVNGGTISTNDQTTICKGDGIPDPITADLVGASGENSIWIVTAANGLIVDLSDNNVFDFEGTSGTGICVIWHLSWDGEIFGLEVGANAFDLQGECFDLSNPLEIMEFHVDGGTISTMDSTSFCTDDGIPDVVTVDVTGNKGPKGCYAVTDLDLNILQVSLTGEFDFEGSGEGVCLIWYASYAGPLTLPDQGTNVEDIEGCISLSNPIEIFKEECDDPVVVDCDNWRYFLSDNKNNGTSDIYEVVLDDDLNRGNMTLYKSLDYTVHIAYSEATDELYVVRSSNGSFSVLDVSVPDGAISAEVAVDVNLSGVVTATFDSDGNFYIGAENTETVYQVNKTDGTTSVFAAANIHGGDIAFGTDGELYHVTRDNDGRVLRINPGGVNEDLGSVPGLVTGLATRDDGNLMISTKNKSKLYVGDTDAMYLNKFYTLVFENEVFTMSNGDMASGCADDQNELQTCENQVYYYADHGPGISGTNIYRIELNGSDAILAEEVNLSYQAHIAHSDDASNILYFVNANGNFIEIYNPMTEETAQVSIQGDIDQLFAAVYNPMDGLLYAGDDNSNEVYTINPTDGETMFFADAPVSGGDLTLVDGELFLAKRNSDELYKFEVGEFVLIGSIPDEVNGMCATGMLNELLVASAESTTFSLISNEDGSTISEFEAKLDGVPFGLSNGDLASGCTDGIAPMALAESKGWIEAYPNPNEGITSISFETATNGYAVVEVFDMNGRIVDELYSGFVISEITYRLDMNRQDLPNGVYLFRLTKSDEIMMGKFIISK